MSRPPQITPGRSDWDVILAMLCFIAACMSVILLLPRWHVAEVSQLHAAPAAPGPAPINLVSTPVQKAAALSAYRQGMQDLQARRYQAATLSFKKALEKAPVFPEAYIGLGEASGYLGSHEASVLNAQHGLDQIGADPAALISEASPETAQAWGHRVLGQGLLQQAQEELGRQDELLGRMDANRARFHCQHVLSLNKGDQAAQLCAETAERLARHP